MYPQLRGEIRVAIGGAGAARGGARSCALRRRSQRQSERVRRHASIIGAAGRRRRREHGHVTRRTTDRCGCGQHGLFGIYPMWTDARWRASRSTVLLQDSAPQGLASPGGGRNAVNPALMSTPRSVRGRYGVRHRRRPCRVQDDRSAAWRQRLVHDADDHEHPGGSDPRAVTSKLLPVEPRGSCAQAAAIVGRHATQVAGAWTPIAVWNAFSELRMA
jgi:hypothetical protein